MFVFVPAMSIFAAHLFRRNYRTTRCGESPTPSVRGSHLGSARVACKPKRGGTKKSTSYYPEWKTPKKRAESSRVEPYGAVGKCHKG